MFVMEVMPHGRGVYHLPQASSPFRSSQLWGLEARAFPAGVRLLLQATFTRQPSTYRDELLGCNKCKLQSCNRYAYT